MEHSCVHTCLYGKEAQRETGCVRRNEEKESNKIRGRQICFISQTEMPLGNNFEAAGHILHELSINDRIKASKRRNVGRMGWIEGLPNERMNDMNQSSWHRLLGQRNLPINRIEMKLYTIHSEE